MAAVAGQHEKALAQMQTTVEGLRRLGPQGESNLAEALESLGEEESQLGRLSQADVTLKEAVTIREKSPDDLWELAEARERLGENLLKTGGNTAPDLLKTAARDLESQLGADHPQTLRAKAALDRVRR
jgi:tetratricopeptide (TPR) repeat protein